MKEKCREEPSLKAHRQHPESPPTAFLMFQSPSLFNSPNIRITKVCLGTPCLVQEVNRCLTGLLGSVAACKLQEDHLWC